MGGIGLGNFDISKNPPIPQIPTAHGFFRSSAESNGEAKAKSTVHKFHELKGRDNLSLNLRKMYMYRDWAVRLGLLKSLLNL